MYLIQLVVPSHYFATAFSVMDSVDNILTSFIKALLIIHLPTSVNECR